MATALTPENALGQLPQTLRRELLSAFNSIISNFRSHRWEPSELNGGKLCEVVYSILRGHVDGSFPAKAKKPKNMVDDCRALENATNFPRSVRIQIPRMLVALYEIRNNRGVGHVGGDVDPNHMDATNVVAMAKWILAELVRVFHDLDPQAATDVVDALTEREVPVVWNVGNRKRVLNPKLSMKDKALLLLYSMTTAVEEAELTSWVEHSNPSVFRRDVLRPLHKTKYIEYDERARSVQLSPTGARYVEQNLPLVAP